MAKRNLIAQPSDGSASGIEPRHDPFAVLEVKAGLDLEIGRSLSRAADQACILESIGEHAFETVGAIQRRAAPRAFRTPAFRIRATLLTPTHPKSNRPKLPRSPAVPCRITGTLFVADVGGLHESTGRFCIV